MTDSAATRDHLYDWPTLGDLRDHLGRDHGATVEQMVGKDRWMLGDLHAEVHRG